jgi:hypothetical protein
VAGLGAAAQHHLDRALLFFQRERLAQHLGDGAVRDHLLLPQPKDLGDKAHRGLEDVERAVRLALGRRDHHALRHARHLLRVRDAQAPSDLEQLLGGELARRVVLLREPARRLADVGRRLGHLLQPLGDVDRHLLVEGAAQLHVLLQQSLQALLGKLEHLRTGAAAAP